MVSLQDSISTLPGIGSRRIEQYARLGVHTVAELFQLYPRSYEDWSQPIPIRDAPPGETCCVRGTVVIPPQAHYIRKNMTVFRLRVSDGETCFQVTLFNAAYTAKALVTGAAFLFFGTVKQRGTAFEMSAPQILPASQAAYIRPIYPQTAGLSSRCIEKHMRDALRQYDADLENDFLPDAIRRQNQLCVWRYAIQNIHFPQDAAALQIAKQRLIFDELFLFQLGLSRLRTRSRAVTGTVLRQDFSAAFAARLPFSLTGAQQRAIADCIRDMRSPYPMSRLIQGDVGSGKTAVAASLVYSAAKSGLQSAFMAPTEILAQQHAASLQRMLGDTCRIALLTGSLPAAEKRQTLRDIQSGAVDIVIGTQALFSDAVHFARLGLVITDEQHRFGVRQRTALAEKGEHPHVLVMSATPIPRTLAMFLYGDLDVSILDELPPGRQPIATYAVDTGKRERVYAYIRKHVQAGRQAYIVCPLVEEKDGMENAVAATAYFKELSTGALRDIPIGLLHGQMAAKDKENVMRAFANGDIKVLVATVVIEVGVDVPNAVLMVIENADRFGLSQLHQLRGRVGRGTFASSCILISDATGEDAQKRLQTMCATADGFQIAETDLQMRGPGDFFGDLQHGKLPGMHLAHLLRDMQILQQAHQAAEALLHVDPALSLPEHRLLAKTLTILFTVGGDAIPM